jgi:DNA-binding transcriptional MerR regulator
LWYNARCTVLEVPEHEGPWPIDEFARIAGTTGRNVRLYQTRQLLPPPERNGRVGLYSQDHLRRLRLILRLLERGYSLAAIHELVVAWEENRTLSDVLGFEEALAAFRTELPQTFTAQQLAAMFPSDESGAGLVRAVELGILVPEGDGLVAPVPSLLDVGADLVAAGVPLASVLDASAEIHSAAKHLADVFVRLFLDTVWQPFVDAGEPAERWPDMIDALDRLRSLWAPAVVGSLAHALQQRVDEATAEMAPQDVTGGEGEAAAS